MRFTRLSLLLAVLREKEALEQAIESLEKLAVATARRKALQREGPLASDYKRIVFGRRPPRRAR